MSIILYKKADKTVADIAARNALTKKPDDMVVTVLDAIADPDAGAGVATYRWNQTLGYWLLISSTTSESMSFNTEELLITDGSVTASNIPINGKLWNVTIVSGDVIQADIRAEDLIISGPNISNINATYNGLKLRFTYGFGSITTQMETYMNTRIAEIVGNAPANLDTLGEIATVIDAANTNTGTIADFEGAL